MKQELKRCRLFPLLVLLAFLLLGLLIVHTLVDRYMHQDTASTLIILDTKESQEAWRFLEKVGAGDVAGAYGRMTKAFQANQTIEQFEAFVEQSIPKSEGPWLVTVNQPN